MVRQLLFHFKDGCLLQNELRLFCFQLVDFQQKLAVAFGDMAFFPQEGQPGFERCPFLFFIQKDDRDACLHGLCILEGNRLLQFLVRYAGNEGEGRLQTVHGGVSLPLQFAGLLLQMILEVFDDGGPENIAEDILLVVAVRFQ